MTRETVFKLALRRALTVFALGLLSACASPVRSETESASPVDAMTEWLAIDSILRGAFPADEPGGVAIVVRDGELIYRGASGMADLELGVPLRPEMVFAVASMTKQFTAIAILMLAEEGKLSLSDPVTRFIPDYPVGGRSVTVQHLLGHTSGIRSYTSMPEWHAIMRNDVTTDELIAVFRDQPFQFEPGEEYAYNNSGYALLGAIIERVSGIPYGEFLRTRILEPLGMTSSYLELGTAVIPHRVSGYSRTPIGWANAEFGSSTHAFAAGAMLSSVDDLARWDAAITRGELISPESWRRAFTPFTLNDGRSTGYGAGWLMGRLGHLATIEHGGDIPGFNLHGLRIPDERLYVAVLTNSLPPGQKAARIALEIARRTLGIPTELPEVPLAAARLDDYVGTYRHGENSLRTINREGERLYSQVGNGPSFEIYPVGEDLFALVGTGGSQLRFTRQDGRVAGVELDPRVGMRSHATRVEEGH